MNTTRARLLHLLLRRGRWRVHIVIGFVLIAWGGCGRPKVVGIPPSVSAVGPSQRLMADVRVADAMFFDATTGRVRISGAVNSVVAFQLMISTLDSPAAGIELVAEDFNENPQTRVASTQPDETSTAKTITRDAVRMYRQWPVTVERYPNWYLRSVGGSRRREIPDALVPLDAPRNGQPIDLPPRRNVAIWIELSVPRDLRPGEYVSAITIHSVGAAELRVPVDLIVRDVYVPVETLVPVLAGVQLGPIITSHSGGDTANVRAALEEEGTREAIVAAFKVLHEHGLSPFTTEVRPRLSQDVSGKVSVDWSEYDAFCEPLINGTAYGDGRAACGWPMPVDLQLPDPVQYDGVQSAAYASVLRDYVRECSSHFSVKGWLPKSWVWFDLARGPETSAAEMSEFRRIAAILNPAGLAPRNAFVSTLIPQSMLSFGWLEYRHDDVASIVDVWATPARYHHRATLEQARAAEKKLWLCPGQPPFVGSLAVEAPSTHARSLPMQAFLEGADAIMIDRATSWPAKALDEPIVDRRAPSDAWLVYPGDFAGLKQPLPSLRLKQLQQGLQDVQLLRLLDVLGYSETARLLGQSLIKSWGTEAYGDNFLDGVYRRRADDPSVWHLARELLLDEVSFAVSEQPKQSIDRATNRAAWAKFLAATRGVEVTPESTRISMVRRPVSDSLTGQTRPGRSLVVTHDVTIRNEMRVAVQGELKVGALPPGGRARQSVLPVGPLDEWQTVRRTLSWEFENILPCDLDGHYVQRIAYDTDQAGEVQADCVLSLVRANPVDAPPTIDGSLTDWVPSEFNTAGDFRLITGASGAISPDEFTKGLLSAAARPRAASQTVAYFGHDKTHLFVGLHAASPTVQGADDQPKRITSDIEYDGLMPVGEDLVEILLDPTNGGSRPDELYHVVIKSNGLAVFEKGVGVKPPICRREPWPAGEPAYAVQRTAYGWTAELAIPLQSFGKAAAESVWGLNITRLEPTRGEYSDWARVPRHSYNPRCLGNLIWSE
ncbi:MAG: DUF4091 domain-containing protein [Planctomycetes bacterium]|nr:DUF4091 domain-containing protein [Planctomycetota bacterium]